jgi:hypothetical protein
MMLAPLGIPKCASKFCEVCYEISWLFSDGLWKIIWFGILPSSLYVFPRSTFAKSSSPHCQVHFMCFLGALLPNHQVPIGQLPSPHCQVGAPTPNWQVHFTLWTAPMSFKLPAQFFNFRAAKGLNIFLSAKNSAPKVQTAHDFLPPHRLPPRALPSLPFSSLSFYLFII